MFIKRGPSRPCSQVTRSRHWGSYCTWFGVESWVKSGSVMHLGVLLWNVMPAQWGNVRHALVWLETRVRGMFWQSGSASHRNEIRPPPPPHSTESIPFASYADCWIYANRTMLDWCRVPLWRPLFIQLPPPNTQSSLSWTEEWHLPICCSTLWSDLFFLSLYPLSHSESVPRHGFCLSVWKHSFAVKILAELKVVVINSVLDFLHIDHLNKFC